jgi:hypothetical protein
MKTLTAQMHRFETHEEMVKEMEFALDIGQRVIKQGDTWFISEIGG